MLPAEMMKQIRRLEIRTDRIVEEITGGAYRSVFKGRGMEFDEVREYTPEDDVRDIDWNVSARMGSPFVKKYVEERELNVMLVVDVSASGAFGSGAKTKRETAAELAALLAFSAGSNGDKVGLHLFSDRSELILPPRSGRKHTLRLIREMLAFEPEGKGTDIASALRETAQLLHKRSVIFIVSDFIDGGDYEKVLKTLNRRHDIVAVRIRDLSEKEWPLAAMINLEDSETGEYLTFAGGKTGAKRFHFNATDEAQNTAQNFEHAKVDLIDVQCGEDPLMPLVRFFDRRRKSRR